MKKSIFNFVLILFCTNFISAQKSVLWSWPSCRNYNGGFPEQPATIFLGDQATFGCDSWADVDGKWPKWQVVIHTAANIDAGTYGTWSSYSNVQHKTNISPRFTSTGTWYWGMKVEYTDAGVTTGWYCRNDANWNGMWGTPTSNLTVTVNALNNPSPTIPFAVNSSSVALTWTKDAQSHNVMIVRKSGGSFTPPTQGTAYNVGNSIGSGTVVYNGPATTFANTGLTALTSYDYIFYSENFSYYSSGVIASATTTSTLATDYFRSKTTGFWSNNSTWESSPDNSAPWITATAVPGASAAATTILNGHTVTLDQNVSLSSFTINSGAIFKSSDATARILTINKSTAGSATTLSNSGTWQNGPGVSTVVFSGAPGSGDAIHVISGTIGFQNIIINKTGGSSNVGSSFGTNSSISGTLEIGQGGFVSTAPPSNFYGTNAILKFNQGTGATYNVNSGDYSWSTTQVPNNISISSGTVNLNNTRTATGNLIIDGGTLSLSAPLTIQGNWTRSSGTFTPNSQIVTLSGLTNTTITTASDASLYDLVVNKSGSGYVLLNSNLIVTHNLTISNGVLTVPSNKTLTVSGTFTNNVAQGLVIKSDATGTGSFIDNGTITGTGTAKIERYLTKYNIQAVPEDWKFHFISSPVGTTQAIMPEFQTMSNNTDDFFMWNEATGLWINSKLGASPPFTWNTAFGSGNGAFVTGKGYLVAYPTDITKNFIGIPFTGSKTINCTNTSGNGWNLLGNPYPSAVDWDLVTKGAGMDGALYYYDNGPPRYRYYVSLTGGVGPAYDGGSRYIPAMQGFMVHAKTSGTAETRTITMDNGDRVHQNLNLYYKSTTVITDNVLNISVEGNNVRDDARVCFYNQATENFDGDFDAYKLFSNNSTIPELYTVTPDNTNVAINTLPLSQLLGMVPVGFRPGIAGTFTFSAEGLSNFTSSTHIFLKDLKTGAIQKLNNNPSYTFSSLPTDDVNRFQLLFKDANTSATWTGIENSDWGTPGNWDTDVPVSTTDVIISSPVPNMPVVNQDAVTPAICHDLTINSEASLTVAANKALTVNGTLTNFAGNTGLVVEDGASLITNGNVSGTATVKRTIPASTSGEWHLISAPISGAVAGIFEGKYLQSFDETTYTYSDIKLLTDDLTEMRGFALWDNEAGFPVSFAGTLNTGELYLPVTRTNSLELPKYPGWNLVGNPYPSFIDWNATGWTKTNVNGTIYIHKDAATWATYNGSIGENGGSQYIAPCQGFFVEASAAGTLGMSNSVRTHNTAPFHKNSEETVDNMIRLEVSGNGYTDESVIWFLPEATQEFDGSYDAHKLFGDVPEAAQLYSLGSTPLAINTLPQISSVRLGIRAGNSGIFNLSATEINDLPNVSLEDTKTGIFTDLLKNSYSFSYITGENEQRFVLHFSPLTVKETEYSFANIYSHHNTLFVDLNNSIKADIYIYTITGQLITSSHAISGMNKFNIPSTGNHIVKVISDHNTTVRKVLID
jgi:hypothetical protein